MNAKIYDKDEDLDKEDYIVEVSFVMDDASLRHFTSPYHYKAQPRLTN